jgi:hypothetical protein
MRIILLTFLFPFFTRAMQLSPEQRRAEDNCLEARLKTILPPDQVIYFYENNARLLNGHHRFHNPLNVYLVNYYTVAIHYDPNFVRIFRSNDSQSLQQNPNLKLSSGFDVVQLSHAKFVEIVSRLRNKSKTID